MRHLSFLDTTTTHRWGYLPQRTSRLGMGAAQFYEGEVFGADAARLARDPWEAAERARELWRKAFAYARRLGIRVGAGFEPYQIPDEIWRALPPEVKPVQMPDRRASGPRFNIESRTARRLLEARLAQLLEAYPDIDHVWLWEDEGMSWASHQRNVPLSVTPFAQAHDFLRRHAPQKRLVLAGWGGVARHFEDFHRRLPGEVIFACLSDSLGWDPIHESFGKLEGRERWPIPWLEDDPAMWLPQFHVHRFERDMNRAVEFGCQGLLGIHWRHRIVDPTAVFQARFSWDAGLKPGAYYQAFAGTRAEGGRAARLAEVLDDADRNRKLLGTFTGQYKDGHAVTRAFSGDYNEAFTFWSNYEPDPAVVASQKEVAVALRELAGEERVGYLAGHVEFAAAYAEAWTLAHRIHQALAGAEPRAAISLWLKLAPEVRRAILAFQRIASTRNDLGTLASLHNKFVRLALVRLRLSMEERLGDLPPEVEAVYQETIRPDPGERSRLILPTRPTMLGRGERVRLLAIAQGPVALHTRPLGSREWTTTPAKLLGRRTYEAWLGPFDPAAGLVEYYCSSGRLASPACWVTLIAG